MLLYVIKRKVRDFNQFQALELFIDRERERKRQPCKVLNNFAIYALIWRKFTVNIALIIIIINTKNE